MAEASAGAVALPVPRHRADLAIAADLIEEVARIHGYDAIPATLPIAQLAGITLPPRRATLDAVRTSLVSAGLTELMTFSCVDASEHDALRLSASDPRRACVRVVNPIHASQDTLRTQLVGTILRVARNNLARQAPALRIFELGRVFVPSRTGELPQEPLQAAVLLTASEAGVWDRAG